MEELADEIVYKPHATMAAYNAFYHVEYEGPSSRHRPPVGWTCR